MPPRRGERLAASAASTGRRSRSRDRGRDAEIGAASTTGPFDDLVVLRRERNPASLRDDGVARRRSRREPQGPAPRPCRNATNPASRRRSRTTSSRRSLDADLDRPGRHEVRGSGRAAGRPGSVDPRRRCRSTSASRRRRSQRSAPARRGRSGRTPGGGCLRPRRCGTCRPRCRGRTGRSGHRAAAGAGPRAAQPPCP